MGLVLNLNLTYFSKLLFLRFLIFTQVHRRPTPVCLPPISSSHISISAYHSLPYLQKTKNGSWIDLGFLSLLPSHTSIHQYGNVLVPLSHSLILENPLSWIYSESFVSVWPCTKKECYNWWVNCKDTFKGLVVFGGYLNVDVGSS